MREASHASGGCGTLSCGRERRVRGRCFGRHRCRLLFRRLRAFPGKAGKEAFREGNRCMPRRYRRPVVPGTGERGEGRGTRRCPPCPFPARAEGLLDRQDGQIGRSPFPARAEGRGIRAGRRRFAPFVSEGRVPAAGRRPVLQDCLRLNSFSISAFSSVTAQGLPWGQKSGSSVRSHCRTS